MGLNIAVTGYFGAGSSAALDLLSEYSCNGSKVLDKPGGYEHTIFYHPGGLFDLEDKLMLGNDIHRSDEALGTFEKEMLRLNNNNFGWLGSYKEMFGNTFETNLKHFIDNLHPFIINAKYYGQCKRVVFNPFKIPVQLAAKILTGRTIYVWGRQFIHVPAAPKMRVAFPTADEFYSAAKIFVNDYMNMYKEEGKDNVLFDRLLLCHNAYRLPRYFDDDFRLIVVERDVRDVYCLNKYLWPEINAGSMYPTDADVFINYWKRLNNYERNVDDNRILKINFEDLIYKYEETVRKIEEHCNLSEQQHESLKKYLKPEKSIKNTQVFKLRGIWKEEIEKIEQELPEYCYDFPYDIVTDVKEMFDDSRTEMKYGFFQCIKRKLEKLK